MIKVYISGNRAEVIEREPLTSGTVGKVISFTFTEDWRLLIKYAVFEGSGRRIALTNIGDSCIIPHEVLAKHGGALRVGVYGRTADGSAATPTVYAQLGIIQRGADPNADPSTKPTLPVWAQILAKIGDLSNLTTEDKTNLVAAINEAATKSVQPDWNQNDPNQPDYVKNRIAYDSRSDEYDGETITLTVAQGDSPTPDKGVKYLGAIDDQLVGYTAVLTGKNKWNETYTVEYESVWIGCDIAPGGKAYSSIAIDPRFNSATSRTPRFVHMDTATEETGPAGLYLVALGLPWKTEYGDMTLTINPRFAKTGELKPIDQKYLGPPAPFNWLYSLDADSAMKIRDKIHASDFSGEFHDLYYRPLNALDNSEVPTVSISGATVTVTYTSNNLARPSALPKGQIISFIMPSRVNSSVVMQVKVVIASASGTHKEYGPYQVVRRYSGVSETIAQQAVSISGYGANEPVVLAWTGSHFMDIGASYVYGGDAFYKPVGVAKGGMPTGGIEGQVLCKRNNANYSYYWKDVYPSSPKQGQVLVASTNVVGNPEASSLKWQDPAVVASDVFVIKATLASYSDTTFLIDYSPYLIRDLIKDGKFVVLVLNDNNGSNTYTYQYIFGNIYSNPNTPQGDGYGWTMPYAKGVNMVVNRISYVGEENDKYKWEIKQFKIPLEEVTT